MKACCRGRWSARLSFFILFFTSCVFAEVTRELVFEISENVAEGTLIGLISGPAPPYLIVGVDSDLTIDQSNGEIRTKTKLDREVRDFYSFVAIPINGENVRVLVHVKDTNDNAPTFPSSLMSVEFPENTPRDVKRTLQPAKDRDLGIYNTQRYAISGGNVNNAFRLSSHRERDGVLYLDLQVNGFLDRETTPFYNLVIDAFDGGVPPLKGSMTVHVALKDVNDNSPIFNQSRYFATISENATFGTSVLQVFATDTDSGPNGQITYSINRRQTDKDSIFKIDPINGVISVNRPLDFESKEVHELVVVARDNGVPSLETTVFVSIRVIDINDQQPLISLVFLTEDGTPKVYENALTGEYVARVSVHDPDSKQEYSSANVTLQGGNGHFGLSTRNDVVYIVIISNLLDREKWAEYSITVLATDHSSPPLNTSTNFKLKILDINDNAPKFVLPEFDKNEFHTSVLEVADPGTSVLQVMAEDADLGNNSIVSYELKSTPDTHSQWFQIDSNTGLITTMAHIDCETDPMPRLTVVARDHGTPALSSFATVLVQIRDVNDNEPIFDQSFYNVSVAENSPVGKCILKVSASDPDCGINAMVNYTIRESTLKQLPFHVNPGTGEICISKTLDYEERNVYEISVVASDTGGLSSTAVVKVQLVNVNDNDPVFYPKLYETSVSEEERPGSLVVTVKATDPDETLSKLTYSITEGNTRNQFAISSENGEGRLTLQHALSPQSERKFALTVKASDAGGRFSTATVYVNVAGRNSPGPVFEHGRYSFVIEEDVPVNSVVGSVSASASGGGKVRYTISSGDPHSYFTIDSHAGIIRTAGSLDHEKHSSVLLNIQATSDDPPAYSHCQAEIRIRDCNDNEPQFELNEVSIWVPESTEVGSVIYGVHARDDDSGSFGLVEYSLLESPGSIFKLDRNGGQITLEEALDYESTKRYTLIIGARDKGVPRRVAQNFTLLVEVQDVNDNAPFFDEARYVITVSESLPVNSHITEVHALDEDTGNNARISYSLLEPEVQGLFGVFPSTGVLYLKSPLDRERADAYSIRITATDHGTPALSATTVVSLKISDENDNEPIFSQPLYDFLIEENNKVGAIVGAVVARDEDIGRNGAVRYSLQPSHSHFQIDPNTGSLTTTVPLDREKQFLYELQVLAYDQGSPQKQAQVMVHVRVSDLNDCVPKITEPEEDRIIVREEQPEGTEVTRIVATDMDNGINASLVFSLVNDGYGSIDAADFNIDSVTGVIRTNVVLEHEKKAFYSLSVRVRDQGQPPLESVQEYRIEVVNLDDSSPTFSRSKFNFKLSESATIGQLAGTVTASDEESGTETGRITFVIIRGNTHESFVLDKSTGGILVAKPLDYELTSHYLLQVRAVDNKSPQSTVIQVSIEIIDENDGTPFFVSQDPVLFSVPEDTAVGSPVRNFTAVDSDDGLNGVIHYSIASQIPEEKFRINTLTGTLYLHSPLDYETQKSHMLILTATDQALDPTKRLNSTITVHINTEDRNDNSPKFISAPKISVYGSEPVPSLVHTVMAVDADSGENGRVTYRIASGNEAGYFELNSENGHLSLAKSLSREQLGDFALNITGSDQGSPTHFATQILQVTIQESTSNPPQFGEQRYEAKIQENSLIGTEVLRVTAFGPNNTLFYVIPEAMAEGKFAIHPSSGSISVAGLLDREAQTEYLLTVYAHDGSYQALYDTTTVLIRVLDLNDNAPRLSCPELHVPENEELGVIATLNAVDPDTGRNGEVTYSISSGNPDSMFSIDLHSGKLKSRPLDRERRSQYQLLITAQDQGLPVQRTSCNVTVTVGDENDNSPLFTESHYSASISENVKIGTTVLVVEASDADIGINSRITYSLNNESHWHFSIDNATGAIVTAGKLNREKIREYSFEVAATDGGLYDSRSSKAQVRIVLTDANTQRPQFKQNPVSIQISPHTKLGQNILQLSATDLDEGLNGEISYSIENAETKFRIQAQTGIITPVLSLASERGRIFQLRVVAKDQGSPALSSTALVVIQVGEVLFSNTLRFQEASYVATVPENSLPGTDVVQVTALRNDGRRQKILYSIVGGNEDNCFEIVPNSGQLRVADQANLDRELLSNYSLIISARTDGPSTLFAHAVVNISLTDENDSPIRFTQDTYSAAVWEGNSKGAFVIQVVATDNDEGSNANLIYYIVEGNQDNAFIIEPPYSGIIKTNIVLDREIQDKYRLTIMATDEGSPQMTGTSILQINVIDINDNKPSFPPHSVVSISENLPIGSLVTTMIANDVDTNPSLVYTFTPSGNPGKLFSIGKYNGQITLAKPMDYETAQVHSVQVQVSDSVHTAFTNLTVHILDFNDNAPKFSIPIYRVTVPENTKSGSSVLSVNATDLDSPPNRQIKYSLQVPKDGRGNKAGRGFWVDENTGTVYTNGSVSSRLENSFVELTVIATDSGKPRKSSKATLWIEVRPSESEVLQFSKSSYTVDVLEDVKPGTRLLKTQVDYDKQLNSNLHFHYSIQEGNEDDLFSITSHTGEILVARRLDQTTVDSFKLIVSVDCVSTATKCNSNTQVHINRKPVKGGASGPKFNQTDYKFSVSEDKLVGSSLFKIQASDPTGGDENIRYDITSGNDDSTFEINPRSGAVVLKRPLDYDTVSDHRFVVRAQDSKAQGKFWSLAVVQLNVEDANDHIPHFPLSHYLEFVPENEPIGTTVFVARASDLDKGRYGKLNYSILEAGMKEKFQIEPTTGLVTTKAVFDYEAMSRYSFTLRATDIGGQTATVRVQIEVESRDEYPPQFSQKSYKFVIPSNAGPGHILGRVHAKDEDRGADGVVLYQISQQNGHFKINKTNGAIILKQALTSDLNTSVVIVANSGRPGSKFAKIFAEISIGAPSEELEMAAASSVAGWVVGLLVTFLLLLFLCCTVFLVIHLRHKKQRKKDKPECNYNNSAFDTLEYAQSTMLAGNSRPTSLYSPQYSDLADLGVNERRLASNTVSELSDKSHSASSGRGSAEDGEEVEDEEIRMINEGSLAQQRLRDIQDLGMLGGGDDLSQTSAKNTQEYLARLGIRPKINEDHTSGPSGAHGSDEWTQSNRPDALDNLFEDEGGGDGDDALNISTLIYAQIPDDDVADGHLDESRGGISTQHQPSMTGSLSSIVHSEEELTGSYNWDYLLDYLPQYQPLAHVFSEIARLKEEAASSGSEAHYSGVHHPRRHHGSSAPSVSGVSSVRTNTSAHHAPRLLHHSSGMNPRAGPLPPLPILPRSPISHDATFASPLSPSFSPELSFCSSPPGIIEPNLGNVIRTTQYHPQYSSSDSSEMRI